MTELPHPKPAIRKTAIEFKGRHLVVALTKYGVTIGPARMREKYYVPWSSVFALGAKLSSMPIKTSKGDSA